MWVNADVKSLEIVVAAYLSQDAVLLAELLNNEDIHANNQAAFNLPSRLVAKVFVFRLIYGGGAYSYANDPDFTGVSKSKDYWQEVIDKFYEKYKGMARWHEEICRTARETGIIVSPSGRYYPLGYETTPYGLKLPETKIKNYPVQGFGADLVMLARIRAKQLLRVTNLRYVLASTVHDSIVADAHREDYVAVAKILNQAINDVPNLAEKSWNIKFNLPLKCEIKVGQNLKDLEPLTI